MHLTDLRPSNMERVIESIICHGSPAAAARGELIAVLPTDGKSSALPAGGNGL
jgi:hypothetical protein